MKYQIKQIDLRLVGSLHYISIEVEKFFVGTPPTKLYVYFYNEWGAKVYETFITLDAEVYAQWGTDDEFIVNYVCQDLGIELA